MQAGQSFLPVHVKSTCGGQTLHSATLSLRRSSANLDTLFAATLQLSLAALHLTLKSCQHLSCISLSGM